MILPLYVAQLGLTEAPHNNFDMSSTQFIVSDVQMIDQHPSHEEIVAATVVTEQRLVAERLGGSRIPMAWGSCCSRHHSCDELRQRHKKNTEIAEYSHSHHGMHGEC